MPIICCSSTFVWENEPKKPFWRWFISFVETGSRFDFSIAINYENSKQFHIVWFFRLRPNVADSSGAISPRLRVTTLQTMWNSPTAIKFPDISRFSRQVVRLSSTNGREIAAVVSSNMDASGSQKLRGGKGGGTLQIPEHQKLRVPVHLLSEWWLHLFARRTQEFILRIHYDVINGRNWP